MQARCSLIVCCCKVSGDPNTAVRPSTCACISTVCARSWSPTLPTRATYSLSRALGIALRCRIVREHADALLQHITVAAQVCMQTRYDAAHRYRKGVLYIAMDYGIIVPQGWRLDLVGIVDPAEAYEAMTRVAKEAETLGFHSLWLYDHFHTIPIPLQEVTFECWISTAALARDTTHIRIGQMVTCNSFRNPALLAKMASTVDVLSHGRLNLGISAGWKEQEYLAYGYPFPDAATRLRQLREALQILKAMWTEEETSFEGKYYQVRGAINQPKGVQKPHIPILVAGKGEQVTLKLVARYADACNFTHPDPEEMERKFTLIKDYCKLIGRDYREIHRTIYVNGFVGETDNEAISKAASLPSKFTLDHIRVRGLLGSPDTVGQRLREMEQRGVQEVIIFMPDVAQIKPLRVLAQASSQ